MAGLSAPNTQLLVKAFKDCNKMLSTFFCNFFCFLQTYSFPKWQALSKGHKAALVQWAAQESISLVFCMKNASLYYK